MTDDLKDLLGQIAAAAHDRLPDLTGVLGWLDFGGVAVFAIVGALVAARARQDLVTCAFFATLTGVGGGTLRDLLIGAPVFWIHQDAYLVVCLVAAVLVYLLKTEHWPRGVLNWLDAVGLSAYCVIGTLKALQYGAGPVAAAAMGVVTASVGGILRDVLAMRPSLLLSREIYISAAVIGASLTVILVSLGQPNWVAGSVGALAALCIRAGFLLFGWNLPVSRG